VRCQYSRRCGAGRIVAHEPFEFLCGVREVPTSRPSMRPSHEQGDFVVVFVVGCMLFFHIGSVGSLIR